MENSWRYAICIECPSPQSSFYATTPLFWAIDSAIESYYKALSAQIEIIKIRENSPRYVQQTADPVTIATMRSERARYIGGCRRRIRGTVTCTVTTIGRNGGEECRDGSIQIAVGELGRSQTPIPNYWSSASHYADEFHVKSESGDHLPPSII